ncbi:hypothetical protein BGZ80_008487 [Entomortierella chlamydospora]|uniref:Uncharacterized protein n=1 Tax=Entomortierella chlamydospora TaxID=101097 RepID=A0A9P6MXC7_9FUNG|nr:hypothetical protein BGZ80_008487 [Entomortierella chlamydospora]
MGEYDEQNAHDKSIPALPSIQERRMQLEAFQAERALNKSLRASVRGTGRINSGPTTPMTRSVFRPTKSVADTKNSATTTNTEREYEEISTSQVIRSYRDGIDVGTQESNTRKIIQHFDALSKKSKPINHRPLGVRQHGAVNHRVEKRIPTSLSSSMRSSTVNRTQSVPDVIAADEKSAQLPIEGSLAEGRLNLNTEGNATLGWGGSAPTFNFPGTRSIRQDRPSNLTSGKRKEELYLSQARLLQWHMMNKKVALHFRNQEKSAEEQFDIIGRSILEKQTKLHSIQQRFEVEKELIELESTFGYQRDRLLEIVSGLESFKDGYENLSAALKYESNVLSIPSIDDSNLEQWLSQIQDCRTALETWLKNSKKKGELLNGIAQVMNELCGIVKSEVQELIQCMEIMRKVREVESLESSLLASSLEP